MILKIPKLYTEEKIGQGPKKNIIIYLISNENELHLKIVTTDEIKIVAADNSNNHYCITSNKNDVDDNCEYVLLAKKFTSNDVQNSLIAVTHWLKHPQKNNHSVYSITNSWKNTFNFKEEDPIEGNIGLRNPQIGAIHSILGHLTNANDIATVVLPTGTGKTETMMSILVANRCEKLLVTVPSDPLRNQLANKFSNFGLLKQLDKNGKSILDQTAKYPKVGILQTGFKTVEELETFFDQCNVIISTMDLVAGRPFEQLEK
ncbi:DEAD/DEAH box helicase family protein [Flavobacterium aquicola]|uniref:Type III restriction/modification enzyme restriction subunit n=1 Tax=Flavobacterium aquicola TaxID=1682742 RepID=A0A3E0EV47_9FLAO|nr:DEAD/DEAH box helicase family protein [Flavobacterium aquicola]REH00987.1 type III restriction/modification enzyme restriction subunit [Flavobacterium aquicola]